MDPISFFSIMGIKRAFSGLLKQPLFYVALALLAVGGGTYGYLRYSTNKQVEAAVAGADANATIETYDTINDAELALEPLEQKAEQKAEDTRKGYNDARQKIYQAPQPEREARASALIVRTLNDLERMSRDREAGRVPDAQVQGNGTGVQGSPEGPVAADDNEPASG